MVFKVRYEVAGGHVHCTLFVAKHPNQTWANCGNFCVSDGEEFDALRAAFSGATFYKAGDHVERDKFYEGVRQGP